MTEITNVTDLIALISAVGLSRFALFLMIMNSPSLIFSFIVFGKFERTFLSQEEYEKRKKLEYEYLINPLKDQVSKVVDSLNELRNSLARHEEKLINSLNK